MKHTRTFVVFLLLTTFILAAQAAFAQSSFSAVNQALLEELVQAEKMGRLDEVYEQYKAKITVEWVRSAFNSTTFTNEQKYQHSFALEKIADKLSFLRGKAIAITDRGTWFIDCQRFKEAQDCFLLALSLYRQAEFTMGQAVCLFALGKIVFELDPANYHVSREYYEKALAIYRKLEYADGEAACLLSLAEIALRISDQPKAKQLYESAYLISNRLNNTQAEGDCLVSLGYLAFRQADYVEAQYFYDQALLIFRQIGDIQGEAVCISRFGEIAFAKSDYSAARELSERALALHQQVNNFDGAAHCLRTLGDLAFYTFDFANALIFYEKALGFYQQARDTIGEANSLSSLGDIAQKKADWIEASKFYEQALSLHKKIGDVTGEAGCFLRLGGLASKKSDRVSAQQYYEKALFLYRQIHDTLGKANCLSNLGQIAFYDSDDVAAEALFREASELFISIGSFYSVISSENFRAAVLLSLDRIEEAKVALESAINASLAVREKAGAASDKLRFQEYTGSILKETIRVFAFFDSAGALELFEKLRGRAFLEGLNSRVALQTAGISAADQQTWSELSDQLAAAFAMQRVVSQGISSPEGDARSAAQAGLLSAGRTVLAAETALSAFEENLTKRYEKYRLLRGSSSDSLADSIAALPEGTAALVFISTSGGTGAWLVTKCGSSFSCDFIDLAVNAEDLGSAVDGCRSFTIRDLGRGLGIVDEGASAKTSSQLVTALLEKALAPLADCDGIIPPKLLIIPDGALGVVPWEAIEYRGNPLCASCLVSYAPTLAVQKLLGERSYTAEKRLPLAAFGGAYYRADPAGTTADNSAGSARNAVEVPLQPADRLALLDGITARGYLEKGWSPLPGAKAEAERVIKTWYPTEKGQSAALFTGLWASENALKSLDTGLAVKGQSLKLNQFRILHFAAHGEAVPDFPETSRIVLTQPQAIPAAEQGLLAAYFPSIPAQDGSLLAAEIIGLTVKADLVVLSACETGLGKITATEGVVGLTRSWMTAGANGVLVSLWQVSDIGTRVFMTIFHQLLADGQPVQLALQSTRDQLRYGSWRQGEFAAENTFTEDGRTFSYRDLDLSSPFYWGAFQYWGK